MANEQNLIPIRKGQLSVEELKKRQRNGGLSRSPKKKWASRLYSLKSKGLTDDSYKLIYEVMTERESYALDSYLRLQKWQKECNDIQEKVIIEKLIGDVGRFIHGSKVEIKNTQEINIKLRQIQDINIKLVEIFKNCENCKIKALEMLELPPILKEK